MKPQDRPSLEESYAVAVNTSDLGLPHGDAAGAQGILAAAAWTEVHMGSALRRLRSAWEARRPVKKRGLSHAQLVATGLTSKQAKRQHVSQSLANNKTFELEKRRLKLAIPEYRQAWDQLMLQAVKMDVETPDASAMKVLDLWLDDPDRPPQDMDSRRLWEYLRDCLNRARAALRQGLRGHTKHEKCEE